jgi:hypothetical protein
LRHEAFGRIAKPCQRLNAPSSSGCPKRGKECSVEGFSPFESVPQEVIFAAVSVAQFAQRL